MKIRIEYDDVHLKGRIIVSDRLDYVWNRIKDLAISAQPDVAIIGDTITADWSTVLSIAPGIATLRAEHGFAIEYEEAAKAHLKRYREEYRSTRAAAGSQRLIIPEDQIQQQLDNIGWGERQLTKEQCRDTARLIALSNGANFSVPGAGKTTVAFAAHLLTKSPDTFLLVVAPKNAFAAWDEVIEECLNPTHSQADMTNFIRLEGTTENLEELFRTEPRRLIISYDKLIRSSEVIGQFLSTRKVHVILDESHRMKAGDRSQRGAVLLSLAHLPIRRDILSGTPAPQSKEDLVPQIDFLWPGQGLGVRAALADSPHSVLKDLYVRTTKQELGLPPRHPPLFYQVDMSPAQLALYSILRQEILSRKAGIRSRSTVDIRSARKSVIRLLQASSSPILAVRGMTTEEPETYKYDDPKIQGIFTAVVAEGDSPKLLKACELARSLAASGERCVIWASFTDSVERITELLADLGATYIHGQVITGSACDPNTREGRIQLFHDNTSGCRILVANPAACSEGISLHKICHNAIYVDRTFNAAHYLQSIDRIHRLGLKPGTQTYIHILESVAPRVIGSIDFSVRRRLSEKVQVMSSVLNDEDLKQLALDEEEADQPLDYDIEYEDLLDIIDELSGSAHWLGEEEE